MSGSYPLSFLVCCSELWCMTGTLVVWSVTISVIFAMSLSCCSFFLCLVPPTRRKAAVVSKSNFCYTLRFSCSPINGTRIGINKYASAVAIDMTGCRVSMARFSLNFFSRVQGARRASTSLRICLERSLIGVHVFLSSGNHSSICAFFLDDFIP